MKKKIIWGLLCAILTLAMIACDDDPQEKPDTKPSGSKDASIVINSGDETFTLNKNVSTTLSQIGEDSISIELSKSFTSVRWIVNGEQKVDQNNKTAITLNAADLPLGDCFVTAMVSDGISWYSRTVIFTVGL